MRKIRKPNREGLIPADACASSAGSSPVSSPVSAPATPVPVESRRVADIPAKKAAPVSHTASASTPEKKAKGATVSGKREEGVAKSAPAASGLSSSKRSIPAPVTVVASQIKNGNVNSAGAKEGDKDLGGSVRFSARSATSVACDPEKVKAAETNSGDALPAAGVVDGIESERQQKAMALTNRYAFVAGGAGCLPMPGADILTVTALEAHLIEEIAKIYGHTPTPGWSMRLAGLLMFSIGGSAAGQLVFGSLAKAVPGVGYYLGLGGVAVYSAAMTYGLGRSVAEYFEAGGTPERIILDSLVRDVRSGLESGKAFWRNRLKK